MPKRRVATSGQACRIASEHVLEELVRYDQRRSLGRGRQTTVLHARAGQRPEIVRHTRDARSEGGRAGCSDGLVADGVGDHSIERSRVRLPVGEIRSDDHRHRKWRLVVARDHPDQAIRIGRR